MANENNIKDPAPLSTNNPQIVGNGLSLPNGFNDLRQPGELEILYSPNNEKIYTKNKGLQSPNNSLPNNTDIESKGYKIPTEFKRDQQQSVLNIPGKKATDNPNQLDKLSVLFSPNSDAIYNKYKLQTDYKNGLLKFGPRQPFITVTPNTAKKGINGLYSSRTAPLGSALQDVVRISKYSVSGEGVTFGIKQLVLQGLNAFNETKIYNPLMPVLAATRVASFGLVPRPTRHIEPNLGGVLGAIGLGAVSNLLGLNKPTPPKGTVGADALPSNGEYGGKGLIRGATASDANKAFQSKWGGGGSGGFFSGIGNFFKSSTLFGAFLPVGQPNGEKYKVGENTYASMLENTTQFQFTVIDSQRNQAEYQGVNQRWWGNNGDGTKTPNRYLRFAPFLNLGAGIYKQHEGELFSSKYGIPYTGDKDPMGYRYADYVGYERFLKGGEEGLDVNSLQFSDQIINYAFYVGKIKNNVKPLYFERGTKLSDKTDENVKQIEDNLKKVLDSFQKEDVNANNQKYKLNNDPIGYPYTPIPQYGQSIKGYDYIESINNTSKVYATYFNSSRFKKTIDPVPKATSENKTYGFSGPSRSDTINVLKVLSESDFGPDKKYDPNQSDLISFYFQDLVNKKYIPFRATVTGINENINAEWSSIEYIGRADKLQSYKGFSRSLSFKFNVVANSIKELLPMWNRINYLVGLTKPANYTQGDTANSNIYTKFIIPPFIKFTIGDIYKNQPAVIKSIGIAIPDNISWETLSEENAKKDTWKYLSGVIEWEDSLGKYAQFPRECELNVQMDLLEKERPVVGGNQFGEIGRAHV